ncbi:MULTISPECIES: lateral flagellar basal body rod protein FlgCL [Aeromonas]|jgi:flagellar basal-body rod protein FlgC|uniref:lateral flagellar basal body rod protein FlgCL n=1 Tax=Aeromonas TaxID=642 RepID=UPI00083B465E|nr:MULTISPECIES: lateral flagellar basal body rod protein FlgCL [Aeromonas]ATL93980.1 flagellar basal body rod protein FlgC [Aeromonas sp. CU5]MCE9846587.1 lateral flagellar basal body rod protein FlgCL [Aeromonas allosaccharophila]MCX7127544.1 lateral flagellar basal body rod protein FlgCL [Aeromonas sp.]TNH88969.1 flagellar basal body rod protein FlgC [Aeromonas sobria]TNI86460.1 flagellar basal body rod protein FlgC [Aeromonas sobria]
MSFNKIYDIAGSAMRAQTVRLDTVASNLANVDSAAASEDSAFRAIKPVFSTLYQKIQDTDGLGAASVQVAGIVQSDRQVEKRLEPTNPMADQDGFVYYSNVNVVEEMADMMSASRGFETSVEVINRINSMQQGLLRLGQGA